MVTLITLLPSDNKALLGRSNGFYAPLLIPSDNKPILSERFYAAHYIECASNIIHRYISYHYVIPEYIICDYITPKYNIWYDKVFNSGFIVYACDPPPPIFFEALFFLEPKLLNFHGVKNQKKATPKSGPKSRGQLHSF